MYIRKIYIILLLVGIAAICTAKLHAASITLSAAIPSPFGSFDKLKLVPRETLESEPYCNEQNDVGLMYYNNGLGDKSAGIYVCVPFSDGEVDWAVFVIAKPLEKK